MTALYVTIGILCGLFLVYWIVIYFVFRYAFHKNGSVPISFEVPEQFREKLAGWKKRLDETPKEEVSIVSADGLKLKAELILGSDPTKTVISFHGYRSSIYDLAGAFGTYLDAGCNVLLVHQRAHGKSEGKYITYGVKESEDCVLWAKYIDKKFGGRIFIGGISMGASTALMAADKDLPNSVVGIIADCGYTSPYDIITEVGRKNFHVPRFIMPMVMSSLNFYCKIFGGFSIKNVGAPISLKSCKIPVLLTHGENDSFVPCKMSEQNRDACSSKVFLYTVKDADHGLSYLFDQSGCFAAIKSFFGDASPI